MKLLSYITNALNLIFLKTLWYNAQVLLSTFMELYPYYNLDSHGY